MYSGITESRASLPFKQVQLATECLPVVSDDAVSTVQLPHYVHLVSSASPGYCKVIKHGNSHLDDKIAIPVYVC